MGPYPLTTAIWLNSTRPYLADLREQGQKYSMTSASVRAGGISTAAIDAAQALTDRPSAAFSKGQFDNPPNDSQYIRDYD